MKKTRPTMLAAVLAALVGAGALCLYCARHSLALADSTVRSVVAVTRDLAAGELISRAALDFRELPERYVEERHIDAHELERVVGTRASTAVVSGSSLLWSDLDLSLERRSLSSLVRAGMRAFALPERDVSFAGLLRPGDRVDVLFTRVDGSSLALLQNVLVLTVGDDLGDESQARPLHDAPPGTVTLCVSLGQARVLAESEGRGALRLALRNPQDLALVDGAPSTLVLDETSVGAALRAEP